MGKLSYLAKRLVLMGFSMIAVATILFLLFRLSPGNPASVVVTPSMPAETREQILRDFGLNQPLYVQYYLYMQNLFVGNLGVSFMQNQSVTKILAPKLLNTMVLMLSAILIAFTVGPLLGALFAWRRGSRFETVGIGTVLIFYAAPIFWTGMLGIMVFSFKLNILPSGGMHSVGFTADSLLHQYVSLDFLEHLILPLTITTLYWLTAPTFIMRNNMIDTLGADFIEMNRAEGLPEFSILYKHAARNSILPVLHYGALAVGLAFGSSVIIETVFSWPGLGRMMWQAVLAQDYPLAQGAFLILAAIIIFMNFVIDIVSVFVDPRVTIDQ